ncbi:MAG: hypothetical protein AAF828_02595 [Bacteroidota bacterium]
MDLSKQLDGFELKLRQLASQIDRQRAEKEALETENKNLKSELDRQRGVVSSLKEKLEKVTVSVGTNDHTGHIALPDDPLPTAQLRAEIDQCVREIDACIEWLQQQ